ncbi:MAG TPA: NAD(P)H-binding protein [Opitutaceae bacterium]|nr:NAD(P)H-binding protein [Opitutaceae bacterium]
MKRTFVITGATGNIGNRVARLLLNQDQSVRVLGRSRERLQPLIDLGATPYVGDMRDLALVTELFRGADAALLVCKGNRTSRDYRTEFAGAGRTYAAAAQATGLKSAVFISSLGAHDERNRGLILMHGDVEQILNEVDGLNVVHLRAPGFFENLFYFLPLMREHQRLITPIALDARLEMAATADVADIAVQLLSDLGFGGKSVIEIYGQREVTMTQIAKLLGEAIERPFPAEFLERDDDIERMVRAGIGRDFATLMNDVWSSISRRSQKSDQKVGTRRATTEIETFLRQRLVPALQAAAPAAAAVGAR